MPSKKEPSSRPSLSLKEKISFGVGDISHGLAASATGLYMMLYMTDVAGLLPVYAGLAVMIGRVWDSVTDPLMGWITDRTKSRWGSRRPYLLFGAVPYALSFFALWVVPEFSGDKVLIFAYISIALLVFNTFLTVVFVPYTSLTAVLTDDYDERTSLTGYRMASSQIAFLIGAAIPSILVAWIPSKDGHAWIETLYRDKIFGDWAGTVRESYFIMGAFFAVLMAASILICFWGTKEKPREDVADDDSTPLVYASSIIEEIQGNKPFRSAVLILLVTNCATTIVATNLAYYIQYVLDMETERSFIFFLLFSSAILAMPVWVKLAKKYGKAETYFTAMLAYPVVLCSLVLLGPESKNLIYIVASMAGFLHAAALMLPWAIIPDVVEYDQLKSGKRREGLFYGGTTFCYKMASALAFFLSGVVLDTVGYVPNEIQSQEVQIGIKTMIGPVASGLLITGALLAWHYPLTKERHAKILKVLERRKVK